MQDAEAGLQARFLQINLKALRDPCGNHSLNLVVVDNAKSSIEALLFFGVDAMVCSLLIFHATLNYLKKECAAITQIEICYPPRESDPHLTFAIPFG